MKWHIVHTLCYIASSITTNNKNFPDFDLKQKRMIIYKRRQKINYVWLYEQHTFIKLALLASVPVQLQPIFHHHHLRVHFQLGTYTVLLSTVSTTYVTS